MSLVIKLSNGKQLHKIHINNTSTVEMTYMKGMADKKERGWYLSDGETALVYF